MKKSLTLREIEAKKYPPGTLLAQTSVFSQANDTKVERVCPLKEILEGIRDGKWSAIIAKAREIYATGDKKRYRAFKPALRAFTVSGALRTRAESAGDNRLVAHSDLLQADFDAAKNPGMVQSEARAKLQADPHVLAVFVGPSGAGIKAIIRIDGTRHEASVDAAFAYFQQTYGFVMDKGCREIVRLCFVSHDPLLWMREGPATVLPVPELVQKKLSGSNGNQPAVAQNTPLALKQWLVADVRELLGWLPKERPDYETWIKVISGVSSVLPMAEAIHCLQDLWPPEEAGEYEEKWKHRLGRVTIRTVIHMAQARGFDAAAASRRQRWMGHVIIGGKSFGPGQNHASLLQKDADPAFQELEGAWTSLQQQQFGDAKLFERKCWHQWKYDEITKGWRRYNPDRGIWVKDMVGEAMLVMRDAALEGYDLLKDTITDEFNAVEKRTEDQEKENDLKRCKADIKQIAKRTANLNQSKWCSGVMVFAQRLPAMRCRATDFNQHPHLLVVQNGMLDLKNNTCCHFSPNVMITATAPVNYIEGATCPLFDGFLLGRMAGDQDTIDYIWRCVGYSLTGFVDHDALFLCYGSGQNGKTTFFAVLERLLGPDLALEMDISVLMGDADASSTVDYTKSMMEGKRLITTAEAKEGKPLNEALLKKLLGGQPITARRPYESPYTFNATHKIWLGTNHKPTIKGTDRGIWRRIHLIPWEIAFTDAEKRPREEMVALYCTELPGILNRALLGYGDFLARGSNLDPPAAVVAATAAYQQTEDTLGNYLSENLIPDLNAKIKLTALLTHYTEYCKNTGSRSMIIRPQDLAGKLRERKMIVEKFGNGGFAHLIGFRLEIDPEPKFHK